MKANPITATPITPPELVARVELAQAIVTLGRLLPAGMEVTFYRPANQNKVAVETTYPNGQHESYWFNQAMH